jgi:HAD superfamily hydrolase (TIGR01509 family)
MQASTEIGATRSVILDFGHTIVDFALNEQALLATYEEARDLLVDFCGDALPSAADLVETVSKTLGRRIDESYGRQELEELDILHEFNECFTALNLSLPGDLIRTIAAMEHRALTAELYLPPANARALEELRAEGYKLGLVSNITLLGASVREDLHRLALLDLFDAVILSSELGVRKPHPRIYSAALEALGTTADQAIFVGDRLREDIGGPRDAGMRAILTHEFRQDERSPGAPVPDAIIGRLADLPAAVRRLNAVASRELKDTAP